MASAGKSATVTPAKEPNTPSRSMTRGSKMTENANPNLSDSSQKPPGSPPVRSAAKGQRSAPRNPDPKVYSPRNKIRERKFVVVKKKARNENGGARVSCKCGENAKKKCLCVAYESLRASQEDFFKIRISGGGAENEIKGDSEKNFKIQPQNEDRVKESDSLDNGDSSNKRSRDEVVEEARKSVPEPGSGRVKLLIKAFEDGQKVMKTTLKSLTDKDEEETEPEKGKAQQQKPDDYQFDLFLTLENLGLNQDLNQDRSVSTSWDSGRGSISSKSSNGASRGSRRKSTESSATGGTRRWKKKEQARVTSLKPFRLRTEQRGKMKEEEFVKKLQEMTIEEKKRRVPIAQGLPWTTDEPECLIKPPVKEITEPVDPILYSDVRAVERAEFDNQIEEKMSLVEQYKLERERQQKLAEEEETKRLRKELVPKAQPMPYFDRPFIPKRSVKQPTKPKEPKFHKPQHKKIKGYQTERT